MLFLRKNILLILSFFLSELAYTQDFIMTNNTTDNTCTGFFYDTGGPSGAGYTAGENKTHTLCSDGSAGAAIKINFSAFHLDSKDTLRIYDGPNTSATLFGKFTNDDLLGLTVVPTTTNPGGCLTFNFTSDNSTQGFWEGDISCGAKCTFPTADINNTGNILRLCPGNSLNLSATNSTAGSGSITEYKWFSKIDTVVGSSFSTTFPDPTGLNVELRVTNSLGCTSINKKQVKVMVSTPPDFTGTTGDNEICLGEQACFTGVATGVAYKEPIPKYTGGSLALPDGQGVCFSSVMTYNIFTSGQKLTNINDFLGICVDMEHSYIQDLKISITCPNGQSVKLTNVAGGGRFMGVPIDDDARPNDMGTCGHYCWTPSASGYLHQAGSEGQTIPYGDYKSIESLSGLLGCPLNGEWKFEVCDNLHSDNGFLCAWDLNINPAIIPSGISFTPTFNANATDSTAWVNDPTIITTSANADQICAEPTAPGNKSYTYRVINNFGCTYDTTLSVKVYDYPTSDLMDTLFICSSVLQSQLNVNISPNATGTYQYQWLPATGLNPNNIKNPNLTVANAQNFYELNVTDDASPGCTLKDTIYIQKIPVPTASLTMSEDSGCVPLKITYKDNTVPTAAKFTWNFSDGTSTTGTIDTAVHTFNDWGDKTIEYIIETSDGCKDTSYYTAYAAPLPLVLFNVTPPYAYKDYPYFCFQNVTEMGGTNYQWIFGTEGTSNQTHDCFMFSDSVKCHNVSLISQNASGCIDTLTKPVCVKNYREKIYVPTAFTPNKDGVNDVFTFVSESIPETDYVAYIYDRWGNEFYKSTKPNSSWDGTTAAGDAQQDVYVYIIYYRDEYGNKQKLMGHISLIR